MIFLNPQTFFKSENFFQIHKVFSKFVIFFECVNFFHIFELFFKFVHFFKLVNIVLIKKIMLNPWTFSYFI